MLIKSLGLPFKKYWQFAWKKILSSVTIFNLHGCSKLSSLQELPGFKSCLDVEVVSLTSFLSAHLPCMMTRGSEGFVNEGISSKEVIILTFAAKSFSQFRLLSLEITTWQ